MAVLIRVVLLVLPAIAWPLAGPAIAGMREQATERDIKAAFLYNFTRYIEWPPEAFAGASEPFRLCVIADEDFTRRAASFVTGEQVHGRPIEFVVPPASALARCHILFVGRQAGARLSALLAVTAGRPVLTVGETPDFIDRGGMVLFEVDQGRVRFDIHLGAASRAKLVVSSKLVRVARRVRESTLR